MTGLERAGLAAFVVSGGLYVSGLVSLAFFGIVTLTFGLLGLVGLMAETFADIFND
jgi:hypothetical protein